MRQGVKVIGHLCGNSDGKAIGRSDMKEWARDFTVASLGLFMLACAPMRTIDGTGNNRQDPEMGATGAALLRLTDSNYTWTPRHPSAREISNLVCQPPESSSKILDGNGDRAASDGHPDASDYSASDYTASDMVWQWGQFLDHDLGLTVAAEPDEPDPIRVPRGDDWFDPFGSGEATIEFVRSTYRLEGGSREQINQVTAWIDGSNIYGSDLERASALRMKDGSGRLATSAGGLLPFNVAGFPNAGGPSALLFLAGDVRANEQVGLTAMHTLWVREHNLWADQIRARLPHASGDEIYEAARIVVAAELQIITYREFLPRVLGRGAIAPYAGYDPSLDASIANEFSTAAYRFGHSMLSPSLLRLDAHGRPTHHGPLALRDAFFAPQRILDEGGIEPLLRGLAQQQAQEVDPYVIDDVRNFLFGPPGSGGFDLAALNIQRGRDHGLASYNDVRAAMGFERARDFRDISSDSTIRARLEAAYGDVERVELWIGGLAEDHAPGAIVGPLVRAILVDQFTSLRDGDRFWYAHVLPEAVTRYLERTARLSTIIRRNTTIGRELPDDVFRVQPARLLGQGSSRGERRSTSARRALRGANGEFDRRVPSDERSNRSFRH
jgi:hypothetical protein